MALVTPQDARNWFAGCSYSIISYALAPPGGARASSPALGMGTPKTRPFVWECKRFKRAGRPRADPRQSLQRALRSSSCRRPPDLNPIEKMWRKIITFCGRLRPNRAALIGDRSRFGIGHPPRRKKRVCRLWLQHYLIRSNLREGRGQKARRSHFGRVCQPAERKYIEA